jgi:hypothetical protein
MPNPLKKITVGLKKTAIDTINDVRDIFKKKKKSSDEERTNSSLPPPSSSPPWTPAPPSSERNRRTDSDPNLMDYNLSTKTKEKLEAEKKLKEDQDKEAERVARETADSRRSDAVRPWDTQKQGDRR